MLAKTSNRVVKASEPPLAVVLELTTALALD
jgi:hypothetical protein